MERERRVAGLFELAGLYTLYLASFGLLLILRCDSFV